MVGRLLLRLRALDDLEGFLRGRALVDDRPDAADHADGIRRLPDVAAHVDALRAVLDRIVRELEGVEFRLQLRAARDDERDRARLNHLREIFAVIRLDEMGPELGGDSAGEAKVSGVSFLELLAHRGDREDRHAGLLTFVDEFSQVHERIVLVGRADENRERDRGGIQPHGLLHRGGDLLVREVFVQHARAAAHPEDDRHVRARIDRGAHDAACHHHRIRIGQERLQRLARDLEFVRRPEEVSVVRGQHDGVAVGRADDSGYAVLESPGHVTSPRVLRTASNSAASLKPFLRGSDHFLRIRWLSPNSCHRYPFAIASRYASMTRGNPINAASIARWLVTGSWKPVSNPSTDRTGFPGWTKRRVNPCRGRTSSGVQADSRARTTVVPIAMTRWPPSRVRFTRSAVAAETSHGSGYTACCSTRSVSISRLLTPEWRRTDVNRTPAASSAARILGVIGRAAEGISALPGTRENRLWYASRGQTFWT